ncbi:glycosyl transferase [candidate division WOR-1 bacterium RIFOXYD2_FULL_36_8]|uniref:Glycosyl transferase n=1 Tax=candidate division WOR-1 bacterium RIFOXYB2_FULL_36_35 TaxID=1802578 RepID=A0A1F4S157_UNCSA|nr:MAG: glycosyl transferase [candidate division WOR-1 bacterium RIFOXYA2_FULL_36_21]OGC14176.1 MAG: glycosyl transferase [candidate division WOR-1 bacterium RIFOXYB2_FULL_36_35]OGC18776.1 MAG: glycosyl transferase [candidate division WOR-1 bacterium RIFOXYA12_FULL_36_13]OGC40701.1 MAG: glycosyl transferase [candidate division WOR-1 bacterium RIFOXYD2_FULL_36_8]
MRYGYFDMENNEYVVKRPDTPTPWINYIGGGKYGGIVSNTGGGYSFDRDPKNKRVLRYRYNSVPVDQPGRYIYLRDEESKNFWSATWQPTMTKLNSYECRHGMGYTKISASFCDVETEVKYFVPGEEPLELWALKIKNKSSKPKKLKLFTYAEFSFYDAVKDQTNVDWCQQINQAIFEDNSIFWAPFMKTLGYTFFSTNAKIHSFDTDREKFIGNYRSLTNPQALINGKCSNSEVLRGNGVGSLCVEVNLAPQEEKEIVFILGVDETPEAALPSIEKYRDLKVVHESFENLRNYWNDYISNVQVKTPDKEVNQMLNLWNQYQCKSTFNWSRFVSLYQLGVNRGMGFRDTAQDTLGVMHTIPQEAKETIKKLLKIQYKKGYAAHQFYPLTGEIDVGDAAEGTKKSAKWYSDDHLWIILSVCSYLKETGDFDFLKENIPFLDGEGTVLDHLQAAIDFSNNHVGKHGLTLAGWADWDDTLNLDTGKGEAESVWTSMLLGVALLEMMGLCKFINKPALVKKYKEIHEKFKKAVNKSGWDGKWYLRAYTDEGKKVGASKNDKAKIYLLVQSWAVMAGFADSKRSKIALDSAHEHLNTKYGLVLIWPAYNGFDWRIGGTTTYPPGAKENGGIFLQTNPWQVIAQALAGDGDRSYQYGRQILPSAKNEIADQYEVEPYVYCQNILGKEHPQFGLGRNSWLTGTAAWAYVSWIQYILGVRPEYDGLRIDPCIPKKWKGFEIKKNYRGTNYYIVVRNPNHISRGVKEIVVDGKKIAGNLIPIFENGDHHVEVILG